MPNIWDELLATITKNYNAIWIILNGKYFFKWAKLKRDKVSTLYDGLRHSGFSNESILIILLCRMISYLALEDTEAAESLKTQIIDNFGYTSSEIKDGLELILKTHKDTIERNFKENGDL